MSSQHNGSRFIILPTRDILVELDAYDSYFSFMKNGLRSAVREAVATRGIDRAYEQTTRSPLDRRRNNLAASILDQYSSFIEQIEDFDVNIDEQGRLVRLTTQDHRQRMEIIEMVSEMIDQRVQAMLQSVLDTKLYEFIESSLRWKNRDLVGRVFELDNPRVVVPTRRPPSTSQKFTARSLFEEAHLGDPGIGRFDEEFLRQMKEDAKEDAVHQALRQKVWEQAREEERESLIALIKGCMTEYDAKRALNFGFREIVNTQAADDWFDQYFSIIKPVDERNWFAFMVLCYLRAQGANGAGWSHAAQRRLDGLTQAFDRLGQIACPRTQLLYALSRRNDLVSAVLLFPSTGINSLKELWAWYERTLEDLGGKEYALSMYPTETAELVRIFKERLEHFSAEAEDDIDTLGGDPSDDENGIA